MIAIAQPSARAVSAFCLAFTLTCGSAFAQNRLAGPFDVPPDHSPGATVDPGERQVEPPTDAATAAPEDDGAISPASRASGLKLVRALCGQIGGSFEVAFEAGTKCSVRFKPEG